MIATYSLSLSNIFWPHGRDRSLMLHDIDMLSERRRNLQVQVKSGDFFITLATTLDELTKQLTVADKAASEQLQIIITDLLHLQAYYSITKKP